MLAGWVLVGTPCVYARGGCCLHVGFCHGGDGCKLSFDHKSYQRLLLAAISGWVHARVELWLHAMPGHWLHARVVQWLHDRVGQ